eukprot:4742899-Pyramimonas_sp.AAC.1
MSTVVKLLRLRQVSILQQLRLEEALLRVDKHNWLIVNDGTPEPAVVMGLSGYGVQPLVCHETISIDAIVGVGLRSSATIYCSSVSVAANRDGITVIKRYSGGGTVRLLALPSGVPISGLTHTAKVQMGRRFAWHLYHPTSLVKRCPCDHLCPVVVDKDTVFASLVFNSSSVPDLPSSFPREIMSWTEGLYRPAFSPPGESSTASFALREHGALCPPTP